MDNFVAPPERRRRRAYARALAGLSSDVRSALLVRERVVTRCVACLGVIWPWQRRGRVTVKSGRSVAWHVRCEAAA